MGDYGGVVVCVVGGAGKAVGDAPLSKASRFSDLRQQYLGVDFIT